MKGITTIAALPGSGSGCVSALPAEVGRAVEKAYQQVVILGLGAFTVCQVGDVFEFSALQDAAIWKPFDDTGTQE